MYLGCEPVERGIIKTQDELSLKAFWLGCVVGRTVDGKFISTHYLQGSVWGLRAQGELVVRDDRSGCVRLLTVLLWVTVFQVLLYYFLKY
ncbi:hypothetical protein Zmor_004646 [Zophobas morio]|uniref:Uncharacterized protein n=1 Tax=Zophobas morio TaxID=2755281 RepID=A0AA38IWD7_9CUCU|nr:hypothetical protein Zmor_004646 [Zophobas morio]